MSNNSPPEIVTERFEKHIYDHVRLEIENLPVDHRDDIYALSFWVYDEEEDPRRPVAHISYNTIAHARGAAARASSDAEAKWNFAFWLQTAIAVIGERSDSTTVKVRENWLTACNLTYSDEDADADLDHTLDLDRKIHAAFWSICAHVARQLHDDHVIARVFDQSIPIIIHNLEYHEGVVQITQQANPNGVPDAFLKWVESI